MGNGEMVWRVASVLHFLFCQAPRFACLLGWHAWKLSIHAVLQASDVRNAGKIIAAAVIKRSNDKGSKQIMFNNYRLIVALVLCTLFAVTSIEGFPQTSTGPKVLLNVPSNNPAYERNKANVLAFYDMMFNQSKPAQAMQQYGDATYTQHNPEVADGREAFIAYFEQMAKDYPGKSVAFKRVFADGNYVVLHSEHTFPGWRGGNWAAIDIFRLDGQGKIVEHWDALQKVPRKSANKNGMY
jgi:predicted SnoaL-like aldol condensation-catalyzing enzyme